MEQKQKTVAFISAEYALDEKLPIYAGGLGVLSADYAMQASHSDLSFVALGMFYSHGFASSVERCVEDCTDPEHIIDIESTDFRLVEKDGETLKLKINLGGQDIFFQAWEKDVCISKMYLLDCNVEENSPYIKRIGQYLYEPDFSLRLMQEGVLGIGSVILLEELDIHPDVFHLNEGHSGLAGLEILSRIKRENPELSFDELVKHTREHVVSTKHTILPASGLHIPDDIFHDLFDDYLTRNNLDIEKVYNISAHSFVPKTFSGTQLMLSLSREVNGVSKIHAEYEKRVHSNSQLIPITNGVNQPRWQSKALRESDKLNEIWYTHQEEKKKLLKFIKEKVKVELDPDILTFVWARRITPYKRPDLVFKDLDRLVELVNESKKPIQIIFAGKANASDLGGQATMKALQGYMKDDRLNHRMTYLVDYDLRVAEKLVKGADVWLNTPLRGKEACGTSGMKAALNGALQCSVSDGWFDEVNWEKNELSWVLNEEKTAKHFYELTANKISPLYYENRENGIPMNWVKKMRELIKLVEKDFTTERMLKEYREKLYKI